MFPIPAFRHLWCRHFQAHQESVRKLTWARVSRRWEGAWR